MLHAMHVAHIDALPPPPERDCAVHGASVYVNELEAIGQAAGDCALACARGAIDRDNYYSVFSQL